MKRQVLLLVLAALALAIQDVQLQESEQKDGIEGEGESETHASGSGLESGDEDAELVKRGGDAMNANIGYLFKGYSILEGNPLDPSAAFDPGFKTKIFRATYEQNRKTDDRRWDIPDNVDIVAKEACSSSFSSESVMTESDYQRTLKQKASVSVSGTFSIVEAAFTASTEYNKKSSLLKKNTKTIIRSEATCTIYEGRVQTGTPPKFTENFLQSVKLLGEKPEYGRFLDTFGTHFVEAVDMGARYTKLQEISKDEQEKLKSQGIDVSTTASASAGPLTFKPAEGSVSVSSEQKDKFEESIERTDIVTIGSKPPRDGTKETWMQEAVKNPLPTSYRLRSIVEIFGPAFFKEEDGVDFENIKAELSDYLEGYCQQVKGNRLPSVQCAGPPKGCKGGSQCSVHAECNDNPDSEDPQQQYDCNCKKGYEGNGRICSRKLRWMPGPMIEQNSVRGESGTWGGVENCRNGIFATGFLLRAEKYQGAGDDSGANAVCLKCDDQDVCSKMGNEGEWSPEPYMCPKGSYLSGWRQNVEPLKGWGLLRDDTALNNVEYKCRDAQTWELVDAKMKGQGMERGVWSRFKECPRDMFICGIDTRVDDPGGDDKGLSDIKHLCCKPIFVKKKKKAHSSKLKNRRMHKV